MSKVFKQSEVAEHKKPESLWIIVDGDVYDVTKVRILVVAEDTRAN
jgi:cytochrome b involved in lipid metabolism